MVLHNPEKIINFKQKKDSNWLADPFKYYIVVSEKITFLKKTFKVLL